MKKVSVVASSIRRPSLRSKVRSDRWAYSAAKSGMVGMTFVMARDLGSMGIRANAIAPSLFNTGLTAGISDEFANALVKDAAFPKRMGMPRHYAIQAIAIYENAMMNGGTIRVDAGQRFAPR